jgi:superfamily II DNA or RNA helicase
MPDRWKNFSLWPHQKKAVKQIEGYLRAYDSDDGPGAALIGMPTGSGKTGIMAVVSRALSTENSTLILVPSTALRKQVHEEITDAFWETIGDVPRDGHREVEKFLPSGAEEVFDQTDERSVYVCTIQTLSTLWRKREESYFDRFKSRVDQVIFDEGHREPAHKWSRAVRSLNKPTILFTATPYRNDFSYFNVERDHTYVYSYHDAVEDGYIREVDFREKEFEREEEASFSHFAEYAVQVHRNEILPLVSGEEEPKVIIRCSSKSTVKGVTDALLNEGADAIGIHSKFSSEEDNEFVEDVPEDEDELESTFLVHQFKLIEGIDLPSIRGLIFYDGFANARSVVQQIGRIIRNPEQQEGERAIVWAHSDSGQRNYWKGYLEYERQHEEEEEEQSIAINSEELFERLLEKQGEIQYIDREYRSGFNFDEDNLHKVFRYPRSVNVFRPTSENIDDLVEKVRDEWEEKGYTFTSKVAKPDETRTRVVPYIIQGNSPVLRKRFFLEVRLGFFFLRKEDSHLFFYDSEGGTPRYFRDEIETENRSDLERLFHGEDARAQSVSLNNSDVGRDSIRRRTLHAFSIDRTAPSLSDHAHFCSMIKGRAKGRDDNLTRRYLGFSRGRVSDRSGGEETYGNYISWLGHISDVIRNEELKPADVLNRYAQPADVPDDPSTAHILLDLGDMLDENVYRLSDDDEHLEVEEMAHDVEEDFFTLTANGSDYEVKVHYNRSSGRYTLKSDELDNAYVRKSRFSDRYRRGIISQLNIEQAFRIVPAASGKIYSSGEFYKPRGLYGDGAEDLSQISSLMTSVDRLQGIESEKGEGGEHVPDRWDPDSLFGIIHQTSQSPGDFDDCNLARSLRDCSILVCDDMRYEVADFIAASEEGQWVAFVHVKGKMGKRSASDWQEICGQALKNLEAISPYSNFQPPNLSDWSKPWPDEKTKDENGYYVDDRIHISSNGPTKVWDKISNMIHTPNVTREVWMVVGADFSLSTFKNNIKEESPKPEVVNLVYLLQSTWTSIQEVGANMRIFCMGKQD